MIAPSTCVTPKAHPASTLHTIVARRESVKASQQHALSIPELHEHSRGERIEHHVRGPCMSVYRLALHRRTRISRRTLRRQECMASCWWPSTHARHRRGRLITYRDSSAYATMSITPIDAAVPRWLPCECVRPAGDRITLKIASSLSPSLRPRPRMGLERHLESPV